MASAQEQTADRANEGQLKADAFQDHDKANDANIDIENLEVCVKKEASEYTEEQTVDPLYIEVAVKEEADDRSNEIRPVQGKEKDLFPCSHCALTFNKSSSLNKHMNSHRLSERPFECGKCKHRFKKEVYLQTHMTLHSNENAFECDQCPKKFRTQEILFTHLQRHDNKCLFKCEQCPKEFYRNATLVRHMKIVHGDTPQGALTFPCQHCSKVYKRKKTLENHVIRQHKDIVQQQKLEDNPKIDGPCQEDQTKAAQMDNSEPCNNHHSCSICKQSLDSLSKLQEHLSTCKFSCNICHKSFNRQYYYISHMATAHKVLETYEDISFQCPTCRKKCSTPDALRRHIEVHLKQFSCTQCSKTFKHENHLQSHLRSHALSDEPEKCPFCHKVFKWKANLDKHMTTHVKNNMAYMCNQCYSSFKTEPELLSHLKVHIA